LAIISPGQFETTPHLLSTHRVVSGLQSDCY
jgi:hypothetical protein